MVFATDEFSGLGVEKSYSQGPFYTREVDTGKHYCLVSVTGRMTKRLVRSRERMTERSK